MGITGGEVATAAADTMSQVGGALPRLSPTGGNARPTWKIMRRLVGAWLRDRHQFSEGRLPRLCPICGHRGVMIGVGHPLRWDARCANCGSRERHRLLWLWATGGGFNRLAGKRILHFAPEKALRKVLGENDGYETADLYQRGVDHHVDVTRLPMPGGTYDIVIANHVLEHIDDDRLAIREMFRVLRAGGTALLTVPVNPSRAVTYENPAITDPIARHAHFNARDHRRYYGLDFADRLMDAGFLVETFRLTPAQEVEFGLLPMEWLYVATRPDSGSIDE